MNLPASAAPNAEQQLRLNVRPQADGCNKLFLVMVPSGQVIGEVTIWAAGPNVLPLIAANLLNWANQQAGSGVQIAGAQTLDQLDRARKVVNGDH